MMYPKNDEQASYFLVGFTTGWLVIHMVYGRSDIVIHSQKKFVIMQIQLLIDGLMTITQ